MLPVVVTSLPVVPRAKLYVPPVADRLARASVPAAVAEPGVSVPPELTVNAVLSVAPPESVWPLAIVTPLETVSALPLVPVSVSVPLLDRFRFAIVLAASSVMLGLDCAARSMFATSVSALPLPGNTPA